MSRENAEERLGDQELAVFFEGAAVGLHSVGPDGIILRANSAELAMLGYSREEYVGHHIAEFHVDRPVLDDILHRLAQGETLRDYPARMRASDGTIREVLITSNALFEDGKFIHTRCLTLDVTELKRAQEAQARLAAIVESSDDAIMSIALDGTLLTWNAGAERLYGYTSAEAAGQPVSLTIPAELHGEEQSILERLRRGEKIEHYDTVRIAKDGRRLEISLTISPIRDAEGRVIGASKVARDITRRNRNLERLRSSESRLAAEAAALTRLNETTARLWTLQNLDEGLEAMLDATIQLLGAGMGNIQLLDPQRQVLVIAAQRGFGREFLDYFREVPAEHTSACGRALSSGQRVVIDDIEVDEAFRPLREIARNAGYRAVQSTPLIGRDGQPLGMLSTHFASVHRLSEQDLRWLDVYARQACDFIERCRIEEALRETEQRFARFMDHLPGLAWIKDRQGCYMFANDAATRAFGRNRSELYGRTDDEIFPQATAAAFRENDQRAQASATGIQTIETLQHADGLHHSLVSKFRIPGVNGEAALVGGMAIDVTERIRAEVALRESEQRYRAVLESQAEMVCRFRADGTILFVNGAYARVRGVTPDALIGSDLWEFVAEEDRPSVRAMMEKLTPEAPEIRVENRFKTVDGERWTLWTNRALTFDSSGRMLEAQSTGIDITERRQAEEALRITNEALRRANSDLEQFAYSASHDLQEPIRNISLSSEILAKQYGDMLSGKAVHYLSFITAGAKRMEMLVRDLLMYTQATSSHEQISEQVDAAAPLGKALGNLSSAITESHAQVFFDKLPSVRVREIQLQQLFQNLVANAIKYRRQDEPPRIEVKAERQGPEWLFSVRDNGIGIPPEYAERVFGIFKRLHPEAKYAGTGIGLAICQRIVERNGGRIWVESDGNGKGSTFWFTLPAAGPPGAS